MDTQQFRESYRLKYIHSTGYDGSRHMYRNLVLYGALVAASSVLAGAVDLVAALYLTLGLVTFNIFEYTFHRWVFHRKRMRLAWAYRRHVGEHHGFFTSEAMIAESPQDYHVTLLPTKTACVFFALSLGGLGVPVFLLANLTAAAALAAGIAIGLFQLDFMHLYYHLSDETPACRLLNKLPYLRFLKQAHALHHRQGGAPTTGFNITHPLLDIALGTLARTR